MYRVLLVDDEPWVLESLKGKINWEKYGFVVTNQALNAFEALDIIRSEKPDLVFTDIRMPGISGLELIMKAKEFNEKLPFIVVSGYAEFAYAQKAMNYGAIGFCLKPFDENDISGLLNKASALINTYDNMPKADFLNIFEDVSKSGNESLQVSVRKLGVSWANDTARVIISIGRKELNLKHIKGYLSARIGLFKKAYLVPEESMKLLEACTEGLPAEDYKGIGASSPVRYAYEIERAIEEADIASHYFFISGQNRIHEYKRTDSTSFDRTLRELGIALQQKDLKKVWHDYKSTLDLIRAGACNIKDILYFYNHITSNIFSLSPEFNEDSISTIDQLVSQFDSIDSLFSYLKEVMDKHAGDQAGGGKCFPDTRNELFRNILAYVRRNYFEDISLQFISSKFSVNLSYVSQLFKKETGITFTEYLMDLRVTQACELLRNSDLPVHDISEKVGYSDYFYFSRIFKRVKGITPSAYREKSEKEA